MAFLNLSDMLGRTLRGDAPALSKQDISRTISFARIVLIVGLVFLHYQQFPDVDFNPFAGMDASRYPIATFVNSFILFFFFSVVPLLSMISGWLFFSFEADQAGINLRHRIRRRFLSLYLPMVFWDVLYLAILIPLFAWRPDYPLLGQLNIQFAHARWMDYVNALFGITHHPVGFQFWFIRDLFTTVLVSPLLWLSLRRTPYIGMAVLGAAWLAGNNLFIFFRTDVVFFFYIGGFLRTRQVSLHVGRNVAWGVLAFYLALVTLRTMAPLLISLTGHRPYFLTIATRAMRLVGVVACWGVFQQVARTRIGHSIARYGGLAFFLHSIHYPLIAEIKILLWPLVPVQTNAWMIAHYMASVTLTVTIGLSIGLALARKAPKVFALMNGGRPGTGSQDQNEPSPRKSLEKDRTVTAPDSSVMPQDVSVVPDRSHEAT